MANSHSAAFQRPASNSMRHQFVQRGSQFFIIVSFDGATQEFGPFGSIHEARQNWHDVQRNCF